MRCRTCHYPLWTIEARACPECGAPFLPSEFEFRPNTVAFHCPHCRQAYYGTSTKGHLEPRAFDCIGCGRHIDMDECVLEPAPGVREDDTGLRPSAWLDRKRIGLVRAWFRTVVDVLGRPGEFIASMPRNAEVSDAILFAGISAGLSAAVSIFFQALVLIPILLFAPVGASWMQVAIQILTSAGSVFLAIAATLVAGFCAHGILWLMRSAPEGLARSVQVTLYAQGATSVVQLIPCCGGCGSLGAAVWWCIAVTIMLRHVQRTTTGKAATAAILPMLVSISLVVGGVFAMSFALGATGRGFRVRSTMPGVTIGQTITIGEADALRPTDGHGRPRTPLDAVVDGTLSGGELARWLHPSSPTSVKLGGLNAEDLEFGETQKDRLRFEADILAGQLPPENAPFRWGDAIFLYRDARDEPHAPLVILVTDAGTRYTVITATDETILTPADLDAFIAAENLHRAAANLPPIPDPKAIEPMAGTSAKE